MTPEPNRCPWCGEMIEPDKYLILMERISYVIPKSKPKRKVYFHIKCYEESLRSKKEEEES